MHRFFLPVLAFFLLSAQDIYPQKKEYSKSFPPFSRIEINGPVSAFVEGGRSSDTVEISVRRGSVDDIDINVSGSTLFIRAAGGLLPARGIELKIFPSSEIKTINASAGALVRTMRDVFQAQSGLRAESGAVIDAYAEAEEMLLSSGRNSRITLRGFCGTVEARAEHGGTVDCEKCEALKVRAYAYTGGTIRVNALETLEASSGMGSSVFYRKNRAVKYFSEALGGRYVEY